MCEHKSLLQFFFLHPRFNPAGSTSFWQLWAEGPNLSKGSKGCRRSGPAHEKTVCSVHSPFHPLVQSIVERNDANTVSTTHAFVLMCTHTNINLHHPLIWKCTAAVDFLHLSPQSIHHPFFSAFVLCTLKSPRHSSVLRVLIKTGVLTALLIAGH